MIFIVFYSHCLREEKDFVKSVEEKSMEISCRSFQLWETPPRCLNEISAKRMKMAIVIMFILNVDDLNTFSVGSRPRSFFLFLIKQSWF